MTGQVRIYDAQTSPRGLPHHAARAFRLFGDMWEHRGLLRHFAGRQIRGKFQGSFLGPLWVLLEPLFQFAVYFVVFGLLIGRFDDLWLGALWLFSGIVAFSGVRGATTEAMNSVATNANLVQKVAFPSQLLPVVPVVVETVVGLVGLALVIVVGLITQKIDFGWHFLALPWVLCVLALFSIGFGLTLANLRVFVPDVKNLYALAAMAWFFLSPNFWYPGMFPEHGTLIAIAEVNPLFPILIGLRQSLGLAWHPMIGDTGALVGNLALGSAWAVGFVVLGYASFMTFKHRYADLV